VRDRQVFSGKSDAKDNRRLSVYLSELFTVKRVSTAVNADQWKVSEEDLELLLLRRQSSFPCDRYLASRTPHKRNRNSIGGIPATRQSS
ncbi:hypothetical protein K0M31_013527, partial [Melipona bicolor]